VQIINIFSVTHIWGAPSHFLSRTSVVHPGYSHAEGTDVSVPTILTTCRCFIAQLTMKLWDCGNGKAFWNSLKKIKQKSKNTKNWREDFVQL